MASEDMDIDEVEPEQPEPSPRDSLKIRLKVNGIELDQRPVRAAAMRSTKLTKRVALEADLGAPTTFLGVL